MQRSIPIPIPDFLFPASLIQEALEDERGGYLIDDAAVVLAGAAGLVKNLVRFVGGEALVAQVDGQPGQLRKLGGKGVGFGGLRALGPVETKRIADDNGADGEAAGEPGQGAQIFAAAAAALEREHRLRGEPQLVRDGDADAAGADVEAEEAGLGGGVQILISRRSA